METYQTAKAILLRKTGQVLLLRRSNTHPTEALMYDLSGGIVEPDEAADVALAREIFEETGLKVEPHKLSLVFTRTDERKDKIAFRLVYAALIDNEKLAVKLSWEHDKSVWLEPKAAIEKLVPGKYTQDGLRFALEHSLLSRLKA
ncbi:MAG TPA: NUDIX hydrolase [Candidatus Saccharimonadales bacterium]|nr:NUDIX hydrolase [Candidatus Saccharimonadales bacterium]